jgi:hypothetical protein
VQDGREKLLGHGVGGVPYEWAPGDLQRLLIRSMLYPAVPPSSCTAPDPT